MRRSGNLPRRGGADSAKSSNGENQVKLDSHNDSGDKQQPQIQKQQQTLTKHRPLQHRKEMPMMIFLGLLLFAIYSPTILDSTGFVWDDAIITESPQFNPGSHPSYVVGNYREYCWECLRGLYDIWLTPHYCKEIHYWPMTYTSIWLERAVVFPLLRKGLDGLDLAAGAALSPQDPRPHHFTNVALHVLNACLVRLALRRLGASARASWMTSLLFAAHSMNVESVAWIIERKDVLSGCFYLLAFLCHPNTAANTSNKPFFKPFFKPFSKTSGKPSGKTFGKPSGSSAKHNIRLSLLFYVLALLSKTIAVSLPTTLVLVPYLLRGTVSGEELSDVLAFFAAGVGFACYDVSLAHQYEPYSLTLVGNKTAPSDFFSKSNDGFGHDLMEGGISTLVLDFIGRVFICGRALVWYARKLVWPGEQPAVYERWDVEEGKLLNDLFSGQEGLLVWWVPLFVAIGVTIGSFYLACKFGKCESNNGSCGAVGLGRGKSSKKSKTGGNKGSSNRNDNGASSKQLVTYSSSNDVIGISCRIPFCGWFFFASTLSPTLGFFDYGYMRYSFVADRFQYLGGLGLIGLGCVGIDKGLEQLYPRGLFSSSGQARMKKADILRQGAYLIMNLAFILYLLAMCIKSYHQSAIYTNNEVFYRNAATLSPTGKNMAFNLGNSLMNQNQDEQAVTEFLKAVELDPSQTSLRVNLATTLQRLERFDEAIHHLEMGLMYKPNDAKALNAMGNTYSFQKKHAEAIPHFQKATQSDPQNSIYWGNLGNEYARLGKVEEAMESYLKAIETNQWYTKSRINLASVYSHMGMQEEAVEQLEAILAYEPENAMVKEKLEALL